MILSVSESASVTARSAHQWITSKGYSQLLVQVWTTLVIQRAQSSQRSLSRSLSRQELTWAAHGALHPRSNKFKLRRSAWMTLSIIGKRLMRQQSKSLSDKSRLMINLGALGLLKVSQTKWLREVWRRLLSKKTWLRRYSWPTSEQMSGLRSRDSPRT